MVRWNVKKKRMTYQTINDRLVKIMEYKRGTGTRPKKRWIEDLLMERMRARCVQDYIGPLGVRAHTDPSAHRGILLLTIFSPGLVRDLHGLSAKWTVVRTAESVSTLLWSVDTLRNQTWRSAISGHGVYQMRKG